MPYQRWIDGIKPNLLLIGPRRAGKTTLLREHFPDWAYASLDDFDVLQAARRDPKGLIRELRPRAIIDELQREPSLTLTIKLYIDDGSLQAMMTGSSGLRLLESSADTLAGRIDIRHLPTMAWGEDEGPPADPKRASPGPLEIAEADRSVDLAIRFGGFPEVLLAPSESDKVEILRRFRDTYFTRDLAQISNVDKAEGLLALLHHLAVSIGSPIDYSALSAATHLNVATVKKYLAVLQFADLIFKVTAYNFSPVKRLIKAGKIYFADNGILTSLGIEISSGQRFENFVVSELEKRRKIGLLGCESLHYYRTVHGSEVDVVFELAGQTVAIEVKSGRSIDAGDTRNLRAFVADSPDRTGILFYRGIQVEQIAERVRAVPIALLKAGGWRS